MPRLTLPAAMAAVMLVSGCASEQQMLQQSQQQALDVALARARFDMNCPAATGEVLSQEMVQPAIMNPRFGGVERAEYTVGVTGCNQRVTLVVVCPQEGGGGCFAADGREGQ